MVDFVKMLSHRKGDASTYRPTAGTICLISGPHCDDENGYTYAEFEVLWADDLFILYRKPGCYPVLNKWEHIRSKPLDGQSATTEAAGSIGDDAEFLRLMDGYRRSGGLMSGPNKRKVIAYIMQWADARPPVAPTATKEASVHGVPDGWKLVPVEPDDAMVASSDNSHLARHIYRRMIAAAPAPQGESK